MSDPIEKLNRLGDALEGAPMPLPASEIRARGDRIRRRKHAVIAGAGVAVIAAVAVPVVAFTMTGSDDKPDVTPSPSPTVTDPVPAAPLSKENLLTSDEAIYPNDGGDWQESDTYPGDGQAPAALCQQSSFDGLGADTVWVRTFEFYSADIGAVDLSNLFSEVVAEFPSAAGAESAYETVQGWYDDCLPDGGTGFAPGEVTEVPIGVDGTAERQLLISSSPDDGNFLDVGFVLSGDRIALLTQETPGQDYDWPEGSSPVEQMLPVAAQRLVLGTGTETPPEDGDGTTIPDSFPLAAGWPDDSEAEPEEGGLEGPNRMLPALEFTACDETLPDADHTDRLRADWTNVEDFRARQLTTYADADAAQQAVADFVELYRACPTGPTREDGFTPTYEVREITGGDEAWAVLDRDTLDGEPSIFGETIVVVRVGSAVLGIVWSGHAGYPSGDGQATVDRMLTEAAEPIAAMADLQQADTGADLNDPAATTTIPPDFPLGLALAEPPVEDSETTIDGPAPDASGARALTMCGEDVPLPDDDNDDPEHELNYSVSTIGGYDGRTIHASPTVQDAIDQMEQIRARVQGCDRDNGGDGLSDRRFRTFNTNTGYDSITFDWYYAATENQPAVAGQLYTVLRVANAIITVEWGSEGSAESQADAAPNQVEFAKVMAGEMCIFTLDGC